METQLVREMTGQLMRHEADVAISTLPIESTPLSSEVLGTWSLACVFRAGHPFEKRRSVSLSDVTAERLIAFSPDTPQGRLIGEWWHENHVSPHAQIEVRSGQVACALAACGAGIAIVDDLTARALRGRELCFRPLSRSPSHNILAVHNGSVPVSMLASAFVERVGAALRTVRRPGATPT
jgi:DNA-binding transcriptional LysR family regulator